MDTTSKRLVVGRVLTALTIVLAAFSSWSLAGKLSTPTGDLVIASQAHKRVAQ